MSQRARSSANVAAGAFLLLLPTTAVASQEVLVHATDAIHLAGRNDVAIPAIGGDLSGFPLQRPDVAVGQLAETRPNEVAVGGGAVLAFDATGEATFSPTDVPSGPDGDVAKDVTAVGGISGYVGPGGALVGVFLDDQPPLTDPPDALDFSPQGLGIDFAGLAPELGQVFFIGDGLRGTGTGSRQHYTVPDGATRLFFGTLDGSGVAHSTPGYYVDNDGQFDLVVPEPTGATAAFAASGALAIVRRARRAA
jgi:hypothetical protein